MKFSDIQPSDDAINGISGILDDLESNRMEDALAKYSNQEIQYYIKSIQQTGQILENVSSSNTEQKHQGKMSIFELNLLAWKNREAALKRYLLKDIVEHPATFTTIKSLSQKVEDYLRRKGKTNMINPSDWADESGFLDEDELNEYLGIPKSDGTPQGPIPRDDM